MSRPLVSITRLAASITGLYSLFLYWSNSFMLLLAQWFSARYASSYSFKSFMLSPRDVSILSTSTLTDLMPSWNASVNRNMLLSNVLWYKSAALSLYVRTALSAGSIALCRGLLRKRIFSSPVSGFSKLFIIFAAESSSGLLRASAIGAEWCR